jgi:hypothetical protein
VGESISPWSTGGGYLNFSGEIDREPARTRLTALKNRYDPHNLLRLDQNDLFAM